jgi:hypothetical protein
MPVLHKYKDRNDYYILTKIENNIITFQLTSEGLQRLQKVGIKPGQKFVRAILLELYRTGDVFTSGTGPGEMTDERQTNLDFSNDSVSEKMFPSCANCSSLQDLHLVEVKAKDHLASILCNECRSKKIATFDTSIPLTLVSRAILNRLIAMKEIKKIDASVTAYKELLDAEFESKWEAYRKGKPEQALLINIDSGNQDRLI